MIMTIKDGLGLVNIFVQKNIKICALTLDHTWKIHSIIRPLLAKEVFQKQGRSGICGAHIIENQVKISINLLA